MRVQITCVEERQNELFVTECCCSIAVDGIKRINARFTKPAFAAGKLKTGEGG